MEVYSKIKKMIRKELEKIAEKGELTAGSLDVVFKLLDAAKNCDKIEMYEKYDEGQSQASYRGGSSRASYDGSYAYDGYSERRGRDRMGRYTSRDGGSSRDGGYSGNDVGRNGYSMHDPKEKMIEELEHKMKKASPSEKKIIEMCLDYIEECE